MAVSQALLTLGEGGPGFSGSQALLTLGEGEPGFSGSPNIGGGGGGGFLRLC